MIKRKLESLWKLCVKNRITKPKILGKKILFLATAPCVAKYFEYETVREQFKEYDIACINYMLFYSKEEMFRIKPKYFVLMDPCLYEDDGVPSRKKIPSHLEIAEILNQVNWDCYIVTNVLADFHIDNSHIQYIRLSCFSSNYRKWKLPLFENNLIHMGCYNVIQGAIFFAITFGYKKIALLGCPYKTLKRTMTPEGLHVVAHRHYYDKESFEYTIPFEELSDKKESMSMQLNKRGYLSEKCLWDLKKYAEQANCEIINYSDEPEIEAFRVGELKYDSRVENK